MIHIMGHNWVDEDIGEINLHLRIADKKDAEIIKDGLEYAGKRWVNRNDFEALHWYRKSNAKFQ